VPTGAPIVSSRIDFAGIGAIAVNSPTVRSAVLLVEYAGAKSVDGWIAKSEPTAQVSGGAHDVVR
jgi:hypothetical protein